jgi:hypothetical protein
MFEGEAKSLPKSGAPERCFTQVGSDLNCKHQTRLEKLARDEHSSLLRKSVIYGQKSFITLAPGHWYQNIFTKIVDKKYLLIGNFFSTFEKVDENREINL